MKKMAILFSNAFTRSGLGTITLKEFKNKFEPSMEKLTKNFNIPDNKYEEVRTNLIKE